MSLVGGATKGSLSTLYKQIGRKTERKFWLLVSDKTGIKGFVIKKGTLLDELGSIVDCRRGSNDF